MTDPDPTEDETPVPADAEKPVLTDDEKNALLEGVSSGAIEVHSGDGQKYADVQPFTFRPNARIRKNSYPRLQVLNEQLADRVADYCASVLSCEVTVAPEPVRTVTFGDYCGRLSDLAAVTVFEAAPLESHGLIVLKASAIGHLVEAFFGGVGNDAVTNSSSTFSTGELAICRLFSNSILSMIQDVWAPIVAVTTERISTAIGTDLVEGIDSSDSIVATRFEMNFGEATGVFSIVLPLNMIGPLVPVFDGQKRDRDVVEDARWEKAIRASVPDAVVRLHATVGKVQMPLGAIVGLQPGDVINIEDPRNAIVLAGSAPVMRGKFGVHAGQNAIEATGWINKQALTD